MIWVRTIVVWGVVWTMCSAITGSLLGRWMWTRERGPAPERSLRRSPTVTT
jgi:hypothetical protein